MAPLCFFVLETRLESSPARSLSAFHKLSEPSSNAPAIMPLFEFVPNSVQARSLKLHSDCQSSGKCLQLTKTRGLPSFCSDLAGRSQFVSLPSAI